MQRLSRAQGQTGGTPRFGTGTYGFSQKGRSENRTLCSHLQRSLARRPHALRQIQCLEYLAVHGATNRRTLIRVLGGKGKEIVDSLATLGLLRIESDDGLEEAEAINEALLPPQDKASNSMWIRKWPWQT
mgnify:CR=1 FL=1